MRKNKGKSNSMPKINQLDEYIVGGKGTSSNPFILSEDCPYKNIMDEQIANMFENVETDYSNITNTLYVKSFKKLRSAGSNVQNQIMNLADFSGTLSIYHSTKTLGGYWKSTGNVPSLTNDGNCWIQNITYFPHTDEGYKEFYKMRTSSTYYSILGTLSINYGGKALSSALIARGITSGMAYMCGLATATATVCSIINIWTASKIKTADNNGWGLLTINYATSYHGNWYKASTACYWTTYPKVYIPLSIYSTGKLTNYTKEDWKGWMYMSVFRDSQFMIMYLIVILYAISQFLAFRHQLSFSKKETFIGLTIAILCIILSTLQYKNEVTQFTNSLLLAFCGLIPSTIFNFKNYYIKSKS